MYYAYGIRENRDEMSDLKTYTIKFNYLFREQALRDDHDAFINTFNLCLTTFHQYLLQ